MRNKRGDQENLILVHYNCGYEWRFKICTGLADALKKFEVIKKYYKQAYFYHAENGRVIKKYEHPEI